MNRSVKPFFWLLASFLCVGCVHTYTEEKVCDFAQQQTITSGATQVQTPIQPGGTSGIEIPETRHDFGVVEKGGDYVHAFRVRNGSSCTLRILKVLPG
jgi:hypothetical protein